MTITNEEQLIEKIEMLSGVITGLSKQITNSLSKQPVPTDKDIASALAAAQGEFKIARMSKTNPHFNKRYESLEDVMGASRVAMAKNGLSVSFPIFTSADGVTILACIIRHISGQSIESSVRTVSPSNEPLSWQSNINFLKRQLFASLAGIVASGEDDDGENWAERYREQEEQTTAIKVKPKMTSAVPITREQLEMIQVALDGDAELAGEIMSDYHILALADLPREVFIKSMNRIQEIRRLKTGR